MIDSHKLLFSIFLCCLLIETTAQTIPDTLQLSRDYNEQKDFSSAILILKPYTLHHPNDLDGLQLLGLNYYWGGRYKEADSLYRKGIEFHPESSNLKLDYARMLYEEKHFRQAQPVLESFLLEYPDDIEALEYSGFIHYWWGDYKMALKDFNHILKIYPNNTVALEMVETIGLVFKPYFFTYHEYSHDSQPMKSGISNIETGKFFSPTLKPVIRANWLYFISDEVVQVPWFELGNEFNFFKNKTHLNAEIGVLKNVLSETEVSGLVELTQNLTNKISINITGKSRPYFYTLSSMEQRVSYNALNASVLLTDPNGINLMIFGGKQFFMDNNEISNAFLWILSPDFGWNMLKFNLGYGYSHSDAILNNFRSVLSLDEILTDYQPGEIEGIYDPYFTPENQNIHSLIAAISLSVLEKFEFKVKGNVGIYAYADIPYLYLDKDDQNHIFMNKDYSKEMKVPFEIKTTATYHVKGKMAISANYVYNENFFFYNNLFNLSLKYIFN